jgi:hypothetical protein
MNDPLPGLMRRLKTHMGLYQKLAKALEMERVALMDMDMERLAKVTAAKNALTTQLHDDLPALAEDIQKAAASLGVAAEPLPALAELAASAPPPWENRLAKAGRALARVKREIARRNEANHAFVQEALDMVSQSIHILTGGAAQAKSGYASDGRKPQKGAYQAVRLSKEV